MDLFFFITITIVIAQCGSKVVPQTRIFGGKPAKPGIFPYQAHLVAMHRQYLSGTDWLATGLGCGGTLISNDFVLTAAHCLYYNNTLAYEVQVTLGAVNIIDETEEKRIVIDCLSHNLIPHPMYNQTSLDNDIALVKLTEPVQFSDYIQPATLPKYGSTNLIGKKVTTSGWGMTGDIRNETSDILRYMSSKIQPNNICDGVYYSLSYDINKNLCINTKGKSICDGDSGGPHVIKKGNVKTIVGITSYGDDESCTRGYPQVLTRVSYYMDWIHSNTNITIQYH